MVASPPDIGVACKEQFAGTARDTLSVGQDSVFVVDG
jgi:hypothetical protein